MSAQVLVLGSGISGMTTALCLADAGMNVRVVADRAPRHTTSAVAGALWGPYVSEDSRVLKWSMDSLRDLEDVARDETSGVRFVPGIEASREPASPPEWLTALPGFSTLSSACLPPGFGWGWTYSAPIFDMPVYLDYLERRLDAHAVRIDLLAAPIRSLDEVLAEARVIVNCTGLGSWELMQDPLLTAAWGQLVITENTGIHGFFSDFPESENPTYYIAHEDYVVLGGTVVHGHADVEPNVEEVNRIVERCVAIEPRLERARIIGTRAGLRPVRPLVRLERERYGGSLVVHNYGHGGSGITLSWGCARQVLALIS